MNHRLQIIVWRALALVFLALAVLGAALPVLPTVPFLIAAAWASGKGWPRLEHWLLDHPRYGPLIVRWRENGAVPRRAKWLATVMMATSGIVLAFSPIDRWIRLPIALLLLPAIAIWLWRRPDA